MSMSIVSATALKAAFPKLSNSASVPDSPVKISDCTSIILSENSAASMPSKSASIPKDAKPSSTMGMSIFFTTACVATFLTTSLMSPPEATVATAVIQGFPVKAPKILKGLPKPSEGGRKRTVS